MKCCKKQLYMMVHGGRVPTQLSNCHLVQEGVHSGAVELFSSFFSSLLPSLELALLLWGNNRFQISYLGTFMIRRSILSYSNWWIFGDS